MEKKRERHLVAVHAPKGDFWRRVRILSLEKEKSVGQLFMEAFMDKHREFFLPAAGNRKYQSDEVKS